MNAHRIGLIVATAVAIAALGAQPGLADVRCGDSAAIRVGAAPPPPLPVTSQPPMPAYGYLWTPGYWAWNRDLNDYYWIQGAWVRPPAIGLLWTPGYWAWDGGVYVFNAGYWGPHVGFYGGVRYGFGYWGHGYEGGYWRGATIYYNRVYNNLGGLRVNALYERRVAEDRATLRASFNGGPGGVHAIADRDELAAGREAHIAATVEQLHHRDQAIIDPGMRAGANHGHPALGAPPASAPAAVHHEAQRAASPRVSHEAPAHHDHARAPARQDAWGAHHAAAPERAPHAHAQGGFDHADRGPPRPGHERPNEH